MRSYNAAGTSDVKNLVKSEVVFYLDWKVFGHTAGAAAATNDSSGTLLTGPGGSATGIAGGTGSGKFMLIGLSNQVSIICKTTGTGQGFVMSAKHKEGNRAFGAGSNVTAIFFQDGTDATAAGTAWTAGNNPAALPGTGWTVM
jgi:hypothetical protein